jgi:hypothetical protein
MVRPSCPQRPRKRHPTTHWIEDQMGLRLGLDVVAKRIIPVLTGIEPHFTDWAIRIPFITSRYYKERQWPRNRGAIRPVHFKGNAKTLCFCCCCDGLRAGRPRNRDSIPCRGKSFSLLHSVQFVSEAYPGPYTMGTGELFPWGYGGRSVKLTTHLNLVPRSRMVEVYLQSPYVFHGVLLN